MIRAHIRFRTIALVSASVLTLVGSFASSGCGSSESTFGDGSGKGGDGPRGGTDPGGSGSGGGFGNGGDGGGGSRGDGGTEQRCASAGSEAKLATVNLVFMFDRSGSMVIDPSGGSLREVKWDAVVAAAKSFFGDGQSKGMNAALTFFSQGGIELSNRSGYCGAYQDPNLGSGYTEACCSSQTYSRAEVSLRAMPSGDFATALDSTEPAGGTPTYPAMQGAVAQAVAISNDPAHKGESTVVVLATDGNPQDSCNDPSSAENAAAVAEGAARDDGIKTYVIGVNTPGQSGLKDNLDLIAHSGKTDRALMVDVNDANATKQSFIQALNKIRSQLISCDVPIPAPPAGKTFDKKATNVFFKTGSQSSQVLFNEKCGDGWTYDNWDQPKTIKLCPAACDQLKSAGGTLDVQFGCPTQTPNGPVN